MTNITPLIPKERQVITSYGNGGFTISGKRYDSSVLVFPTEVMEWDGQDFSAIIQNQNAIEILLIGTGTKTIFPAPEVLRALKAAKISVEIMDTGAACRTYSILLAEERRVAAALVAV